MVVKIDINGSIGGGCGGKWHLEVWSWWRRFFKVRMVWGVKVILIREGMVWVLCGCKVVWDVVGRSGEVSIEVSAVPEGCARFVGACKGGGVGSGGFQVGSGDWAKRLLGTTCFLSLDFFLVFFVHGEKFSGGFCPF